MKHIIRTALATFSVAFFMVSAQAQNPGAVTNHAFPIGKGLGQQGYTSLLCGAGQIPVGQSAADPQCKTITQILDALGSPSQGAILYRDSSAWNILAPGTSGQLLKSNGAGANPAWATASGTGTLTSVTSGSPGISNGTASPITTTGTLYNIGPPQGRLTLVTATSVMSSNQTAKGTIFYDCHKGGSLVPYYNGTADLSEAISGCEVSTVMVSAASAGQVVSGQVYDVWWVHGGANRICVAMSASSGGGGGWASDTAGSATARGTGYSQLDTTTRPYITNKNSITNCFNAATNYGPVSANQGTYLGTFYATANGQTGMNFNPAAAAGGSAPILGLFNAYNQVEVSGLAQDSTTSWTYATATWRKADNSASNSVQYVDGLSQSNVTGCYYETATSASSGNGALVGLDIDWSSGSPAFQLPVFRAGANSTTQPVTVCGDFLPKFGLHTIQAVETSGDTSSQTFYGSGFNTSPGGGQNQGLRIRLWM